MDAFLANADPADVFLPLAGGTMDLGANILFQNGSRLREGTTNAGANGGIAMICSIDYELKWEAGRLYVMAQDGFSIRVEQYGFNTIPNNYDDNTKGYYIGSRRILDNGITYVCIDDTTDYAVWASADILANDLTPSINPDVRQLISASGGASVDWDERVLYEWGFGLPSVNWSYHQLLLGGAVSLDWESRRLIASDGIPRAGWNNYGLNFGWDGGSGFYHTLDEYGINTPEGLVVDLGYKQLKTSGSVAVDWANHQLVASDGTTTMLDWSDETVAASFPQGVASANGFNDSGVYGYVSSGSDPSYHPSGIQLAPTAVTSLVGTQEGIMSYVNDALVPVIGSAVANGGSAKCLVCYNGTNWIVTATL